MNTTEAIQLANASWEDEGGDDAMLDYLNRIALELRAIRLLLSEPPEKPIRFAE